MPREPKAPPATPIWREGAHEVRIWDCARPDVACRLPDRGAAARAEEAAQPQPCDVPPYLLTSDSSLPKVAEAVKSGKPLNVMVVGSRSSTIPASEASAYPAQLQAALKEKLPAVPVTVSVELQTTKTAEDVAAASPSW